MSRRALVQKEPVYEVGRTKTLIDVNPEITARVLELIVSEFKLNSKAAEMIAIQLRPISKIIAIAAQ
jgi:hypothetical protein